MSSQPRRLRLQEAVREADTKVAKEAAQPSIVAWEADTKVAEAAAPKRGKGGKVLFMELELVYMYPLTLVAAVPLIKAYKEYELYLPGVLVIYHSFVSKLTYDLLGRPLPQFKLMYRLLGLALPRFMRWIEFLGLSAHHAINIRIYTDTAVIVLIAYVSLLNINLSYIWLAIFPLVALAFIVALCKVELGGQSSTRQHSSGASSTGTEENDEEKKTKARSELKVTAVLPYWVLCEMGVMRQFHEAEKFAISQFLLFLSSTLGALTLMLARLAPTGVTPGLAPASDLLRMASLVALLVTVHTVAAELLGEDVVMLCLPELVPVLLWFSVHLDRGSSIISADTVKSSYKKWLIILGAVVAPVFAYLAASMDESGLSRCTMASVSCGVSGLLVYYVMFMLRQWPGQAGTATASLKEAVQLLKFWAIALLIAAAALLVLESLAAVRLGLHEPMVATLTEFLKDYVDTFLQWK